VNYPLDQSHAAWFTRSNQKFSHNPNLPGRPFGQFLDFPKVHPGETKVAATATDRRQSWGGKLEVDRNLMQYFVFFNMKNSILSLFLASLLVLGGCVTSGGGNKSTSDESNASKTSPSLTGAELKLRPELDFRNKDYSNQDLTEMKEISGDKQSAIKDRAHFDGSNFERVFLHKAKLRGISMKNVNLQNADLSHASIGEVDLKGADLRGCNLEHAAIGHEGWVDLAGAKLEGAKFKGAWILGRVIWPEGFDWKNQGMWGPGVNLRKMDLTTAEHRGNVQGWCNRSMEGADISGSTFANWRWNQFYLFGMKGITAVGTDFSNNRVQGGLIFLAKGANFRNAKFVDCGIRGDYTSSNFQGADFSKASLFGGAKFKRANFTGVNWEGATYDKSVVWPDGFDPKKAGLTLVK